MLRNRPAASSIRFVSRFKGSLTEIRSPRSCLTGCEMIEANHKREERDHTISLPHWFADFRQGFKYVLEVPGFCLIGIPF